MCSTMVFIPSSSMFSRHKSRPVISPPSLGSRTVYVRISSYSSGLAYVETSKYCTTGKFSHNSNSCAEMFTNFLKVEAISFQTVLLGWIDPSIHNHRPYAISLYLTYLYRQSLMSSIPTTLFKSFS